MTSLALLPDRTDIAALPISAALTAWDAAVIMFPVGIALAILVAEILPSRPATVLWRARQLAAVEGIVFLLLNEAVLGLILAAASAAAVLALLARRKGPAIPADERLRLWPALSQRAGEVFYGILLGSLVAAVIKVILPTVDVPAGALVLLALLMGFALPFSPAFAAIPALAMTGTEAGLTAAGLWIVSSVARQAAVDWGWSFARFTGFTRRDQRARR